MSLVPSPSGLYLEIVPYPNMGETALEEAATALGPAFVYTLHINKGDLIEARGLIRRISADVLANPFAPHVNVFVDERLKRGEWFLQDGEKAVGSRGCG